MIDPAAEARADLRHELRESVEYAKRFDNALLLIEEDAVRENSFHARMARVYLERYELARFSRNGG